MDFNESNESGMSASPVFKCKEIILGSDRIERQDWTAMNSRIQSERDRAGLLGRASFALGEHLSMQPSAKGKRKINGCYPFAS